MKCTRCGYTLLPEWNVCPKCSNAVNNKFDQDVEDIHKSDEIETRNPENQITSGITENRLIIVFVSSFTLPILIAVVVIASGIGSINDLSTLGAICYLVATITIVTAHIMFPKNKTISVLFWGYIVLIILFIIIAAIVTVFFVASAYLFLRVCFETCNSCPR